MIDLKQWMKKVCETVKDLKSKSYTLLGRETMMIIPQNSDMNDFTDEGMYTITSAAYARTMSNYPSSAGGRLEVFNILRYTAGSSASNKRLFQRLYTNNANCEIYYRYWNGTSWSAWRLVTVSVVGGVISYLIHLTGLVGFSSGRRWVQYADSQKVVEESVRTGEAREDHIYADKWKRICQLWRMLLRADGRFATCASRVRESYGEHEADNIYYADKFKAEVCSDWPWYRKRAVNCICRSNRNLREYLHLLRSGELLCRYLLSDLAPAPERGWAA